MYAGRFEKLALFISMCSKMAPIIDMLTDIVPTKTKWAFRVHVVRLWENPTFGKSDDIYSLEMVLIDRDVSI